MKKQGITFIILCLALCVSFGFSTPQEEEYYSNAFLRLNYVKGDVFIQRAEDMGFEEGTVNLPIVVGDKLGTRDGRAEIHFGRKNYLRVDKYTQIDFVKLPQRGDDFVSLHLFSGNAYLRINSLNAEKEFELHSPDGSCYILEEGLYRFEVRDNQETALFVVEGALEVAGEEGSEMVRAGERLVVANGLFSSSPDYIYAGNEDSFTEWNRGRDIFHNRYVKTRYLPDDLYEYEAELAHYGKWAYERPYGYVWIPDVYHNSWRPYYNGRWVWYPICGWTWCSYEPWGWSVSHYGRWHWRGGLGWYWIPSRSWGPAWVHWYSGVDYVGWSPLSYYNRPVVIVNNRFYGRHYDRYYPSHSRAFTVLRRDQLSARQVSKVALGQSGLSRLGKVSLSSQQPNVRPASSRINGKNSAASKALSRSNIRPVSKAYSTGKSIRSSSGKSLVQPSATRSGTSRISTRSGTVGKSGVSSSAQSQFTKSRSSRSTIKAYPSRNSSSVKTSRTNTGNTRRSTEGLSSRISRSTSQSSSSNTGIKSYPSQRTSVRSNRTSEISKAKTSSPSSSRSYKSTIKQYSPRSSSSTRTQSPSISRSSTSSMLKQYSSRSRSNMSSTSPRSSSSSAIKRYSSQSRSSTRSTSSRRSTPSTSSYRSTPSRSSYSAPSRSSSKSKIRSSSSSRSYSPSRVSPSRNSSSSRSSTSTSRARVTRSSPSRSSVSRSSSSSRSTKRVKK